MFSQTLSQSKMSKTIYLVRHAQGEHNIAVTFTSPFPSNSPITNHPQNDFSIKDALLTPHGKAQCATLSATFPYHDSIDIVMASPLRRTIQTAIESFAPALLRPGVKFFLVPQAQEISAKPCDTGFEREELEVEVGEILGQEAKQGGFDVGRIDWSVLEEGWSKKVSKDDVLGLVW